MPELSHQPSQKMINFYVQRTKNHIIRVDNCISIISKVTHFNEKGELTARGKLHDISKFGEKEMIPYVWLTELHRSKRTNAPFSYPEGMEALVHQAISRHLSTNRHHPEFHPNPNEMTPIDLIEMVCDWTAISQEFKQDGGSARGWANKNIGKTLHFNIENEKFVYSIIDLLEQNIKI